MDRRAAITHAKTLTNMKHRVRTAITTDDFLFVSQHSSCLDKWLLDLKEYCEVTLQRGSELSYSNLRIIQSSYRISIDQTQHIENAILSDYWKDIPSKSIYFRESPYPIDTSFERDLKDSFQLDNDQLREIFTIHHGSLPKWIGCLMHLCVWTRIDIHYAFMRLGGYMSCPKSPCFTALKQLLQYLYHHPRIPIFYKRPSPPTIHPQLSASASRGFGEILHYAPIPVILHSYGGRSV